MTIVGRVRRSAISQRRPGAPAATLAAALVAVALAAAACASDSASMTGASMPAANHAPVASPSSTRPRPVPTTDPAPPVTVAPPRDTSSSPARILDPASNQPDPFVLVVAGGEYLFSSQTGFSTPPVSVSFSATGRRFAPAVAAMTGVPPWAVNGFTWAPDVRFIQGQYVLYFDAWARPKLYLDRSATGFAAHAQCIGTATSEQPGGPYRPSAKPLVCDFQAHGAIDPRTFRAPDGQLWLDWKADDNANAPGPVVPTHLYAQLLARDGLTFAGRAHELLSPVEPWQNGIAEAPDMVYARGSYWLFYSANWFNQPAYAIGVARCRGPAGPCTEQAKPWLGSNAQGAGPGEESLFEDLHGRWWIVYSPWYFGFAGRTTRPVAVALVGFTALGPYLARS